MVKPLKQYNDMTTAQLKVAQAELTENIAEGKRNLPQKVITTLATAAVGLGGTAGFIKGAHQEFQGGKKVAVAVVGSAVSLGAAYLVNKVMQREAIKTNDKKNNNQLTHVERLLAKRAEPEQGVEGHSMG